MKKPATKSENSKNNKDHFIHKHGYATLFRNREMVEQLVRFFVDEDFYKQLDFEKFEVNLEKSYLSENYKEFADDVLIKVGWKGKEAFIYIIIEFQSTVEHFMSLRVLNYLTMFYLEIISENKDIKLLPPVLPIVLYNGNAKWTAPDNIKDLIEPCTFLSKYYPDFKYFKIIESDYTEEYLLNLKNAVSAVFLMENAEKDKMAELITVLEEHLSEQSLETLKVFTIWVRQLLKNERVDSKIYSKIMNIKNTKEVKSMLVETLQEIKQDYNRGLTDGIEKGVSKGHIEEAQDSLLDVLKARLENIPSATEKKIRTCNDSSKLRKALLQAIWVKSWDEFKF